ncbi:MAG: hypothetical protein H7Y22_06840 [Gemmatimonadaceae bacterium]|nr:hypothetical protein [Gloeobacterales cyanobacterium ES-bin-141]
MLVVLTICQSAFAETLQERPDLREQESLNGTWTTGGTVPIYGGSTLTTKTYERSVEVPSEWSGKIVKVEFESVNFIADIYVNNTLVTTHVGAWNPFSVDVTNRVTPGSSFKLKVVVKGMVNQPIVNGSGDAQWPVGAHDLNNKYGGITDDVWLRAYGKVHVVDSFIQTSYRKDTLTVAYTLKNTDTDSSRTVTLQSDAYRLGSDSSEKRLSTTVTLAPSEQKVITLSTAWSDPALWWPDSDKPALYKLNTRLLENSALVDEETRRFGFRELWASGNQFMLNGVRANLWGDYINYGDGYYYSQDLELFTPANWPNTLAEMKKANIRIVRLHTHPAPRYILDTADEKGMMLVSESSLYGRPFYLDTFASSSNKALFMENAKVWLKSWVKAYRNHPSIVIWSAENELGWTSLGNLEPEELKAFGDTVRLYDTTRPVGYDGDKDVGDTLVNYHYLEGYNKQPTGSIYSWAKKVYSYKPTGSGEYIKTKVPSDGTAEEKENVEMNKSWQGVWNRGLRYINFTDFRPINFWWTRKEPTSVRAINLKNAYAPVALFDKRYDELGIEPFISGKYPTVEEGATLNRTLILYNDEYRNTSVTAEVEVRANVTDPSTGEGWTTFAKGTRTYTVGLGSHIDIPTSFQVPKSGTTLEVIMRTKKGEVKTFQESRKFTIVQTGASGSSSNQVTLGSAAEPTHAPPSSITATPLSGGVALSWSAAPGALSYTIRRSTTSNSNYTIIRSGQTTTSYTNTGLANGTTYYYVVSAINEGGVYADIETANSIQVSAKPGSSSASVVTVSLTNPLNGSTLTTGSSVTVSATATASSGSITKVEFFANGTEVGEKTSSPYSITLSDLPSGSYSLTAKATSSSGTSATSSPVNVTVSAPAANQLPAVSLTGPTGGATFASGADITVSANASDADGSVSKVEFYAGSTKLGEDSTSPYSYTWQNVPEGSYSLTAMATDNDAAKVTSSARTVNVGTGKLVLLVSGSTSLNTADSLIKQRLESMGFSVSTKEDVQATSGDATGKVLVIISSSVQADNVTTKFRSVQVPVLNWESYLFDDMGMIASDNDSNYGTTDSEAEIEIVNSDHPMAAGLSSDVTVYTKSGNMTWATPGTNAIKIATIGKGDEENKLALFGYESGVTMQGLNAPARRVGLFLSNDEASTLTEDGWALFEAAVRWATESNDEVLFVTGQASLGAADKAVYDRLTSQGYKVTVIEDNLASSSDAEGKALVIISATSSSSVVNNKFLDVAVPVMTWEAYIFDDLGMTSSSSTSLGAQTGQTQVTIVNSSQPMAAGLSGTKTIYTKSGSMTWGAPDSSAIKIATLNGNSSKVVIFGYEKGATMPGMEAPARRVGAFLDDIEAGSLNSDGWALFDAAVRWAKGG